MKQLKNSAFLSLFVTLISMQAFAADVAAPTIATKPEGMAADVIAKPTPAQTLEQTKVVTPKAEDVSTTTSKSSATTMYGKTDRPLGDFLVGPYATLLAIPRPVSFGLEVKWKDLLGVSGSYGFFPKMTLSDVSAKITGSDFRFKIYPFQGAFFIGVGIGSQTFTGTRTETVSGQSVTVTGVMETKYIAPQIGWNWIWSSGFFMGMDLGVQLSSSHTITLSNDNPALAATPDYQKAEKDILDLADTIGKTPIPLLTLVKIGYFF